MGLAYISAVLKKNGYNVVLFDTAFVGDKKIIRGVMDRDIRIVMFSVHSIVYNHALELCNRIKQVRPDVYTLFGGWHVLLSPDEVIGNDCVDMICVGEGEDVVVDIMRNIDVLDDVSSIPNVWFKRNGVVIKNNIRPLGDIDELPYPDRDIFDRRCLSDENGLFHFLTMRGCPYNCSFCCNYKMVDLYKNIGCRYIRFRDIDKVIAEMKYVKDKYDPKEFFFTDEMFLTNPGRVKEFCVKYVENDIGIPFGFMARVENVDEDIIKVLRDAGCCRIHFGVESGNEELRRRYLNRHMSNKQIIDAFDLCHRYGIFTASFNMIGLPFETRETIMDTFDLNKRCKPTVFQMTILYPFYGTKIRDVYKMNNLLDTSVEEQGRKTDYYSSCITRNPVLSFSYIKHQQVFMNIFFNYSELLAKISLYLPVCFLDFYNRGVSKFFGVIKV